MTNDIHRAITGNPISKNLLKPWDRIRTQILYVENYLINILDQEILSKNKLIFTHIRVKYIKFMTQLHQIMIRVVCFTI